MWPRKTKNQRDREGLESHEALHSSRKDLSAIVERQPNVDNVATDMLHLRQKNHFSEQLNKIIFKPKEV